MVTGLCEAQRLKNWMPLVCVALTIWPHSHRTFASYLNSADASMNLVVMSAVTGKCYTLM